MTHPSSPARAAVPSAAERAYRHLKRAILEQVHPGGSLISEGEIAEAAGVSRTPVREALLRLEAEGLVALYPKRGALVRPVSAREITDVVEARGWSSCTPPSGSGRSGTPCGRCSPTGSTGCARPTPPVTCAR